MNPLLAAVILSLSQGQTPDLSKKVSFESVAMPAARLVADLGKATGLNLDVSQQTGGEIVLVRVAETPVKDVMDRLAQVVDGEWVTEDTGVIRLVRPAANLNREISAERAERIAAMAKSVKEAVEGLKKAAAKPPANAQAQVQAGVSWPFGGSNLHKHIVQILSRLSPADLALAEDGGRVVFSSNPTRIQKPIPGNLEPIVAELVAEHNKAAEAAKKSNPDDDEEIDEETKKWITLMKSFGFGQDPKPIEGRPAKLLLIVEEQEFMGGITATLRLYDVNGKVATEGTTSIHQSSWMQEAIDIATQKPKPAMAADDKAIEYSATTQEISRIFSSLMGGASRGKMSSELDAKLSRPDLFDPLSFGPSESLHAISRHKKLNLVANLPDESDSIFELVTGGTQTVNTYLKSLEESKELVVSKTGGWLTVAPKRPVEARRKRTDRAALARLIAASKAKGTVGLDDIAQYALTSPSPMEASTAMQYLMLYAPNAMQMGMMGMVDWDTVRLWGSLAPGQRDALASGGQISFGSLSPLQRDLMNRIMFGASANLKVAKAGEKPQEPGFMDMIVAFMAAKHADYRQEPTEIMPMGLPAAGYIAANIGKEPVGRAVSEDPMLAFTALGVDELAIFQYFKEDPNMAQVAGMMPTITKMRVGERTNIALRMFAAADVYAEKMLQDNKVDPNSPIVDFDNLPQDFKDKIRARFEAFKKSPIPGLGFGRQGVPPPGH
jgi:hypothetical protein